MRYSLIVVASLLLCQASQANPNDPPSSSWHSAPPAHFESHSAPAPRPAPPPTHTEFHAPPQTHTDFQAPPQTHTQTQFHAPLAAVGSTTTTLAASHATRNPWSTEPPHFIYVAGKLTPVAPPQANVLLPCSPHHPHHHHIVYHTYSSDAYYYGYVAPSADVAQAPAVEDPTDEMPPPAPETTQPTLSVTGTVDSIEGQSFHIQDQSGGITLAVTANTQLDVVINVGDQVQVSYRNGEALKIVKLN